MRPIVVLLIVLVAISTLISALFLMDGGAGTSTLNPDGGVREVPRGGTTTVSTPESGTTNTPRPADVDEGGRLAVTTPMSPDEYDNGLVGRVTDGAGEPVVGAQVTLDFQSAEILFEAMRSDRESGKTTRSNREGKFSFENIEPSEFYTLYILHDDFCPAKVENVMVKLTGESREPDIVLSKGAKLSGYVRDKQKVGIGGAELVLDVNMFSHTPGPQRQKAVSGSDGYYEFPHVASGMRALIVSADGYGTQAHTGISFNGRDPETRDIELDIAAMLGGQVTSAKDGKPIADAQVLALNYSNSNRSSRDLVVTNKNGEFNLEKLSPGEYTLMVNAHGFNTERVLRVHTGELNMAIKMDPRAVVRGTVTARDTGKPVKSGTLQLRQVHQGAELTSLMDITGTFENGEFALMNVPGGDYLIEATATEHGYASTFSDGFTVTEGQDLNGISIRVTRGATVTGRILDDAGRPVADALVSTNENNFTSDEFSRMFGSMFPTNVTPQKARTAGDGSFTISAIRPDVYQVNVTTPGFVKYVKRDIKLREGDTFPLGDVRLSRGGSVKGTLYDAGGAPLPGGQVYLRMQTPGSLPQHYQVKSGVDGFYTINNVVPGTYMISATSSSLEGDNPFRDIANRKATETKIAVSEGGLHTQDLHLTGQPERTVPLKNDGR